MADVELMIAGRSYRVACRDGEEASLHAAAALVDAKSRDVLAGLGSLTEARQLMFTSLLLADQIASGRGADPVPAPAPAAESPAPVDSEIAARVESIADLLEALAEGLEASHPAP